MKIPVCSLKTNPYSSKIGVSPNARLVRFYPSRILLSVIMLLHVGAVCSTLITSLSGPIKAGVILLLLVSAANAYIRYVNTPCLTLRRNQGEWWLMPNTAREENRGIVQKSLLFSFNSIWGCHSPRRIMAWSYCSRYLVILCVSDKQNQLHYLPIAFDSCRQEEFRWFRVVVKYFV